LVSPLEILRRSNREAERIPHRIRSKLDVLRVNNLRSPPKRKKTKKTRRIRVL